MMATSPHPGSSRVGAHAGPWAPLYRLAFGGHRLTLLLVALDAVAFAAAWLLAYEIRASMNARFNVPINPLDYYVQALTVVVPLWILVTASWGLYFHHERLSSLAQIQSLLGAAKDGLIGSFAVAFLLREISLGRSVVILSALFIFIWLYATRTGLRMLRHGALTHRIGARRVAIVGVGETALRVMGRLANHPEIGYDLIGIVEADEPVTKAEERTIAAEPIEEVAEEEVPVLGSSHDLARILQEGDIDEVFIADPTLDNDAMLNMIARCDQIPVSFKLCSNMMEVITDRVKIDDIADVPVIPFRMGGLPPMQAALKRLMDIATAIFLLVVFAPVMLLIAAWIRITSGAPILFRQDRVGQDGGTFTILKFRTMTTDTPSYATAPNDPADGRITSIGRFLRKTSLDELPQLFNVLRGEMSMVGPRPEMPFIVEQYQEWQRRRLSVKPGITGLWQVIGRKNLPLAQHLEYDFYYIKNQSLFLDLLILLRTIPAVVFGRGAY